MNQLLKKILKRIIYSPFIGNIWCADPVDMQLIGKFSKEICFLLSITDIFNKYAWVIPLKDKKGITITNYFQKIIDESNLIKDESKPKKYG